MESTFHLFDCLVSVSLCNSYALIGAIIIEALIFINTFTLLMESSAGIQLHSLYNLLHYVNVMLLLALFHHNSLHICCLYLDTQFTR